VVLRARIRAVAVALGAVVVAVSCSAPAAPAPAAGGATPSAPPTGAPTSTVRIGPMTPRDPTRIRADEAAAVVELGARGAATPAGHDHGHAGTGDELEVPLLTGDALVFAQQWLAAQRAVPSLDTLDEVQALGYVRASAASTGVGTHWVLWSQVARPFDPARPAMVLYDERRDPPQLVGYSYWLRSDGEPVGFAGPNDGWHQHEGLCVVNGWVDRERSLGPDDCAGTYLAGGDLWMLHAWVVPGWENRRGRFASTHPTLCPPRDGTPDTRRCTGT